MKAFLKACKSRPLILWVLFFAWLTACTAVAFFLLFSAHTALGFASYIFLSLPVLHLLLYKKPLKLIEIMQIIFMYLAVISVILPIFLRSASLWIFVLLAALCFALSAALIILEIIIVKKENII